MELLVGGRELALVNFLLFDFFDFGFFFLVSLLEVL